MLGIPSPPHMGGFAPPPACALGCPAGPGGLLVGPRHSRPLPSGPCFPSQDTVSVHRPSFYAERFFKFMSSTVFRKNSCEPPRHLGREGPRGAETGGRAAESRASPQGHLPLLGHPWASVRDSVQRTGGSGHHAHGAQRRAWGPPSELESRLHRLLPG